MGRHTQATEPLFEDIDGPVLVGIGNWLAESLDILELSNEQVLWLYMMFGRYIDALWREFPDVLLPLTIRLLKRLDEDDE